jgi:chemotaxis protein MotB
MFEPKSTQLTQAGEKILRQMVTVIKEMPNRISITGHSEATNFVESDGNTNWEVTANRANAARRFFMLNNLEEDRVAKVVGRADRELLDPKFPTAPRNRRIEVVLLRASYLKTLEQQTPAPQNLITVPKPTNPKDLAPPVKAVPKAAPKPEVKKDDAPKTKAEKSNINEISTEFKMPDSLKRSLSRDPTASALPPDQVDNPATPAVPSPSTPDPAENGTQ